MKVFRLSRFTARFWLLVGIAGLGITLMAAGFAWAAYILFPDTVGRGRAASPPLPEVTYTREAAAFVRSLSVLGSEEDPAAAAGAPYVVIPALDVHSQIVALPFADDTWYIEGLETRLGHLQGTDAPGGTGNTALAGHLTLADGSPGPLVHLDALVPGDEITILTGGRVFTYRVTGLDVVGQDYLDILYPTDRPTLTIITCAEWSWLDGRYTSREVVTAELVQ